ncbi:NAD-dependent epimerase/dehydratase family protein [Myxococcota bacterium]
MTVLLTGASGFLGSHIAEQLSRADVPVRALVRHSSDVRWLRTLPNVELFGAALDQSERLRRAMEGVTAIVHCAGLIKARNEAEFFRVNTEGTERLLEAAGTVSGQLQRFVLVSSLAAIGPSDERGTPVAPDAAPHPVTSYGRSKRAAERAACACRDDFPLVILRPSAVYGPRDRETLAFFRSVQWGVLPTFGSASHKITLVYGVDAAKACIRAIEADVPSGSAFFVDDGEVYTFQDLVQAAEAAVERRAWLRFPLPRRLVEAVAVGVELYGQVRDQAVMLTRDKCRELFAQWVADSSATSAALGWTPEVKFQVGARMTVAWYREHGWL